MSLASLFFHFTPRLFLMMVRLGAKKLRSRPHNYRFDLWQHFRSQLLRTRWKKNVKKRTKWSEEMAKA